MHFCRSTPCITMIAAPSCHLEKSMTRQTGQRPAPAPTPRKADEDARRKFAKALARDLFGKHYWDDRLEAEKQKAVRKK